MEILNGCSYCLPLACLLIHWIGGDYNSRHIVPIPFPLLWSEATGIKAKGKLLLFLLLVPEASLQEVWAGCLWEVQQQALQLPCHGLWVPGPRLRFLLWLHQGRGVSVCLSLSFCVSICSGRAREMIQIHGWPLNNTRVRGAALRVVGNLGIKRVGPSYPRFCGPRSAVVLPLKKLWV